MLIGPQLEKMLGRVPARDVTAYLDARRVATSPPPVRHPAETPVSITRRTRRKA